jgi:hypothetical protein
MATLEKDIGESNDLAKTNPTLTASRHAQLQACLKKIGADLPTANPNYDATAKRTAASPADTVQASAHWAVW